MRTSIEAKTGDAVGRRSAGQPQTCVAVNEAKHESEAKHFWASHVLPSLGRAHVLYSHDVLLSTFQAVVRSGPRVREIRRSPSYLLILVELVSLVFLVLQWIFSAPQAEKDRRFRRIGDSY